MNELRLPPDTPILYEEGLWELCTDKAYEMMVHKRQFLDKDNNVDYDLMQNYNRIYDYKLYPQVYGQRSPVNCP